MKLNSKNVVNNTNVKDAQYMWTRYWKHNFLILGISDNILIP